MKHLTVRDNLRLAQYLARLPQDDARVADTLGALGIADKVARKPAELSQGEQQRVAIARAVVNRPRLLLADEPTANLDDDAAVAVVDLLSEQAARYGATLVVATHDARGCAFCMPGGPEAMVEIRSKTPVKYTASPVVVSGKLIILRDDPAGIFYRIHDATPVK